MNGRGIENDYNKKIEFEGEYKNGEKWTGKIKEYYHCFDKIKFEGEYLNGEKNCKGKEYNKNGKLIFEGEYLDGKKWNGKGKEYNSFNELVLEEE